MRSILYSNSLNIGVTWPHTDSPQYSNYLRVSVLGGTASELVIRKPVLILGLSLPSCATLGKSFNLTRLQFPHL